MTGEPDDLAAEFKRLSGRVDALMMNRNPPEYSKQLYENSEQLMRHEHALFGVTGSNGISSRVRGLESAVQDVHNVIQNMREQEFKEMKQALENTRASVRRWVLGVGVPLLVAAIGAMAMIYAAGLRAH